jgi:hypothetical protein
VPQRLPQVSVQYTTLMCWFGQSQKLTMLSAGNLVYFELWCQVRNCACWVIYGSHYLFLNLVSDVYWIVQLI